MHTNCSSVTQYFFHNAPSESTIPFVIEYDVLHIAYATHVLNMVKLNL